MSELRDNVLVVAAELVRINSIDLRFYKMYY